MSLLENLPCTGRRLTGRNPHRITQDDLTELMVQQALFSITCRMGCKDGIDPRYLFVLPALSSRSERCRCRLSWKPCDSTLLVQSVDETVVVELFDQTHIDEIFGASGARLYIFLAELGQRFFDRIE